MFCVVEREENRQKQMITEIYKFWVFWSKNGRFVTHICFPKKRPWNTYFYSVCRSTQRHLANVSFFLLLRRTSRNPYFCSVFGTSGSGIVEKSTFLKTSKNQGQKKKVQYRHICLRFLGSRNPYFCSVFEASKKWGSIKLSWSDENGVQLRTRKHIYI